MIRQILLGVIGASLAEQASSGRYPRFLVVGLGMLIPRLGAFGLLSGLAVLAMHGMTRSDANSSSSQRVNV